MRSAIATLAIGAMVTIGGTGRTLSTSGEDPLSTYQIGGKNVISSMVHHRHSFTLGDSRYSLDLERQRDRERRDLLEREASRRKESQVVLRSGDSNTGSGQDIQIIGVSNEQCVIFARRYSGNQKVRGYAGNLKAEGQTPQVGSIALERGHVSVVVAIYDGAIRVRESNWVKGAISERTVSLNKIKGFIY